MLVKIITSPDELSREMAEAIVSLKGQYISMLLESSRVRCQDLPDTRAKSVEYYREILRDPDAFLYIALEEEKLAGYVYGRIIREPDDLVEPPFVEIFEIVVDEKQRRRGVGNMLLRAAEDHARNRGINLVQLAVHEFNSTAIDFYKKHGFRTLMRKMVKELD